MSHNWSFVIAGYAITTVVLAGYFGWVRGRARQLRRTLRDENRE
jgi:heme exporter protein CcmD